MIYVIFRQLTCIKFYKLRIIRCIQYSSRGCQSDKITYLVGTGLSCPVEILSVNVKNEIISINGSFAFQFKNLFSLQWDKCYTQIIEMGSFCTETIVSMFHIVSLDNGLLWHAKRSSKLLFAWINFFFLSLF